MGYPVPSGEARNYRAMVRYFSRSIVCRVCFGISVPRMKTRSTEVVTSIGSNCVGAQNDDLLRMEEDWTTVQGSNGCNHWSPHTPSVTCPGPQIALAGKPLEIIFGINTPDCGISSFSAYGTSGEGLLGPISEFRYGHADVPLRWTPRQVGTYDIGFEAVAFDYFQMREYRDDCTMRVTVVEPEIPVRVVLSPSRSVLLLSRKLRV